MKTRKRQGVDDATAQRLNVRISTEAYQRLMVHCLMRGLTPGRLVEQLVTDHCRDWKVQANATSRATSARPILDTELIGETVTV